MKVSSTFFPNKNDSYLNGNSKKIKNISQGIFLSFFSSIQILK